MTQWIWPYRPDGAVTERLEWRTDVLSAQDGGEQRLRLRTWPRRTLEHDVLLEERDARTAENLIRAHQADDWHLPLWMDGGPLAVTHPAGAVQLQLPHPVAGRDYAVGRQVLLCSATDPYRTELADVAVLGVDDLTLDQPLVSSWPAGSLVMPVRSARLSASLDLRRFTGGAWYGRLGWTLTGLHPWTEAAETDYRGYPVCELASNWDVDPQMTLARELRTIDNELAPPWWRSDVTVPDTTQTVRWAVEERAWIDALRQWFYARRGRQRAFWYASGMRDLVLRATVAAQAITLVIERCGYAEHIQQGVGRRDICVQLVDGSRLLRRITASSVIDDATESITLDAALGVQLAPLDVAAISFLQLRRLDTDAIDLEWRRFDQVDTSFTVRDVRNDL